MEHAEARELLEVAAVEPDGFERLAAGDTPEAAALAGHIAGCPECTAEMERLRRSAGMIRDALRTMPPPELRDRTLAFVAAVGRPRGTGSAATASVPVDLVPAAGREAPIELQGRSSWTSRRPGLWAATLAAAVVLAVAGTNLIVTNALNERLAAQAEDIESLARIATRTMQIEAQADARHVDLAGQGAAGADASGTLVYSPTSGQLAVLASGLAQPPSGMEYRCWVEIGGSRTRIGQMFLGGDVAYWAGDVVDLAAAVEGSRFGVSLVPIGGNPVSGDPILLGSL